MLAWSRGRGMESLSTAEARCFINDSMHVSIIVLPHLDSRGPLRRQLSVLSCIRRLSSQCADQPPPEGRSYNACVTKSAAKRRRAGRSWYNTAKYG